MTYTANTDYWALLGIPPGSDLSLLKSAFRKEARRWHPDLNGNDQHAEERFKLVNEAYAVLSDPRKRAAWESTFLRETSSYDPFESGFPEFKDYVDHMFDIEYEQPNDYSQNVVNEETKYDDPSFQWPTTSEPPPPPPIQATQDLESLVELTPEQGLYGTNVELELDDGTIVEVNTPPLAGDGWRLRIAGVAPGGRDHFLQLRIRTDSGLRIDGLRVLYKLEIFPPDAVLGCAVDVPTLNGQVTLQVPPKSSSGRLLRLRGRGLEYDGTRGDQFVEIVVVVPADLGDAEGALYRRLQELALDPESI